LQIIQSYIKKGCDFVDGIMFSSDTGLIIVGQLNNDVVGRVQRFSRASDPWFYLHAKRINKHGEHVTETVPLRDYLFRYDRGAFWVGKYAFERFGIPFTGMTRFLLDPILHTRKLYQALQVSGASQEHIVQDLTLPLDRSEAFMEYLGKAMPTFPLWLCPIKPEPRSPLLCNGIDTSVAINIGIWGPQIEDHTEFIRLNRMLESELAKMGGKKWMYAHAYYTKEEFWSIYDKKWYTKLRTKYKATNLPDIFEKTLVKDHYKVDARRGLLQTIFGHAKLRIKD
jgi:hypothetical protein